MKVSIFPADEGGCGSYRLIFPAQALSDETGIEIEFGTRLDCVRETGPLGDRPIDVLLDADVAVFQRPLRRELVEVMPLLQRRGIACVVEIDDDFSALPIGHPGRKAWAPRSDPDRNWKWLAHACAGADLITTTTPALAARYAPHGRCVVLPNCVPDWYLDVEGDRREQPTLGWSGTSITHVGDLEVTGDAVKRAMAVTGARFLALGGSSTLADLDVEGEFVAWAELTDRGPKGYAAQVARMDVQIVPLADNTFNKSKSGLKSMESAALGVVPVVSGSPDNLRMARAGVGLVADGQWFGLLRSVLSRPDLRAEVAAEGRDAMRVHTYSGNCHRWAEAWLLAFANRRAAVAA